MSTQAITPQERIDDRTLKAATGPLRVTEHAPGMFRVESRPNHPDPEKRSEYIVDLVEGACQCPDFQWRNPEGGCKHIRAAKIHTGKIPFPLLLDQDERNLMASKQEIEADADAEADAEVATDGGVQVSPADPIEVDDDQDVAVDFDRDARLEINEIVLETTSSVSSLLDFDPYCEVVECSQQTIISMAERGEL